MGMAASQARLLMLTARIHDTEYQAQQIQSAKLQLATQEDEVYRKYNEALDATTLTFRNDKNELVPATFNNLCGAGSIGNGLNEHYVFRTGDDDRLIVPDDVYNGYEEYNPPDAYAFAMYMLDVKPEDLEAAEESYLSTRTNDGATPDELTKAKENLDKKLAEIEDLTGKTGLAKDVKDGEPIFESYNKTRTGVSKEEVNNAINEYIEMASEYKIKLYQSGGAENIYKNAVGENGEKFDAEKFQYYLRWGQLIQNEVDIKYCVPESDYTEEFGDSGELLQQMLQSGRVVVDKVDKKDGKYTTKATSVSSNGNLAYTPTTTIDKTAVAKAEAEYEFAMKKIDKKDKQYDMELNKLETERTALTKEYDSVKKVIQDNIERTFGIFS